LPASVEPIREDFARVQHRVSFSPIPEYKALEQNDFKNDASDEKNVNENGRRHIHTGVGGWKDELGEDDP